MKSDFKSGDVIVFCNEEFIVIENYGRSGKVKENCDDGNIINNFYWEYHGEKCKLKSN